MSKSDAFEGNILDLIFLGTTIANLADNAGSGPLTSLYLSLHTADPGETGDQTSNETSYEGYARAAVARSGAGFSRAGNQVNLVADIAFPACTGGAAQTVRYFAVGTAASGAGKILYSGQLDVDYVVSPGAVPRLTTATNITEN